MQRLFSILGVFFFFFILWIIYLANSGMRSIFFDFVKSFPLGDKLGHFVLFGTLTFLSIVVLKFRRFKFGKLQVYYGAFFVIIFVILEEFSQKYLSTRTFDFVDLIADLMGIISASILANLGKHKFTKIVNS